MNIIPRSAWGAAPAESITRRDPHTLKGVVVHWFGSPSGKKDHADCVAQLRAVQRAHQMGEFNDIAYNHLVCPHGNLYEGRGFGVQTGANGNSTVNREYAAVCAMIGTGDRPGPLVLAGLSDLIRKWREKGAGLQVRTHGSITGSTCPGPDIGEWVRTEQYDAPEGWKLGQPIYENLPGPSPKPKWFWKAVEELGRRKRLTDAQSP